MKILLTGGLGYIGSHIANIIGKNAIIIDNRINSSLNYKKFLPKALPNFGKWGTLSLSIIDFIFVAILNHSPFFWFL